MIGRTGASSGGIHPKLGVFVPATTWAGHPRGGAADFGRSSGVSRRSWDEKQGGWGLLVYVANWRRAWCDVVFEKK